MSIGLVSDDEYEKELRGYRKVERVEPMIVGEVVEKPASQVVDLPTRGRDTGDVNVPDSLRQIIGETAVIEGRQAALGLAGMFGISASSVSAYAKGATSTTTYDSPSKSILSHINRSRQRAIKRAGKTLNSALDAISQEKLDYADAKDLSTIAKDMSVVIKNLEPPPSPLDVDGSSKPQFVIFAPQFRDERSFEVINVSE